MRRVCHTWGPGSQNYLLFLHLLKINASKFDYRPFQLLVQEVLLILLLLHVLNWGGLIWRALRLGLHAQWIRLAWKFNLLNRHVASGTWHRRLVKIFAFSGASLVEDFRSNYTVSPSFSARAGVLRSRKVLLHLSRFFKVLSDLIEVFVETIVSHLLDNLLAELIWLGCVLRDLVVFVCRRFKKMVVVFTLNVCYTTVIAAKKMRL